MNQQNAAEFIPLVQALSEGKTIQFQNAPDEWIDSASMDFCYPPDYYRIKPQPREFEGLVQSTMRTNGELKWITVELDGYHCESPKPGTQFRLTEIL